MYTFHVLSNLTQSQQSEGELLALNVLGEGTHPNRVRGFILSRVALENCLRQRGINRPLSSLTLDSYFQVTGLESLTISLSHTPQAGAALVAERKDFQAVGIDIEDEARAVKDSIIKRIAHPADANFRNIELWCAKEAAFKALMNTGLFPKPIEFSSIQIAKESWFHSPSNLSGEWKLMTINSTILAMAFLKNQDTSRPGHDQQS